MNNKKLYDEKIAIAIGMYYDAYATDTKNIIVVVDFTHSSDALYMRKELEKLPATFIFCKDSKENDFKEYLEAYVKYDIKRIGGIFIVGHPHWSWLPWSIELGEKYNINITQAI